MILENVNCLWQTCKSSILIDKYGDVVRSQITEHRLDILPLLFLFCLLLMFHVSSFNLQMLRETTCE